MKPYNAPKGIAATEDDVGRKVVYRAPPDYAPATDTTKLRRPAQTELGGSYVSAAA